MYSCNTVLSNHRLASYLKSTCASIVSIAVKQLTFGQMLEFFFFSFFFFKSVVSPKIEVGQ